MATATTSKREIAAATQHFLVRGLDWPAYRAMGDRHVRVAFDRGFEPDERFYTTNLARVVGKTRCDMTVDPPPDLTIEIDVTHRSLDRQGIYAAIGVPELWRFDGSTLLVLGPDGDYLPSDRSPTFPPVPLDGISRHALLGKAMDDTSWK
ncbi:MAG: hypothetical protein JWN86_2603 [Planctomycetota bacterium]|nr:hypothetical protein [Planctomycetota bacterium]